jgi:hypothetical protein
MDSCPPTPSRRQNQRHHHLVDFGKIGKVLSSTILGSFFDPPTGLLPQGAEQHIDINNGGNAFTIFFRHTKPYLVFQTPSFDSNFFI